MPTRVPTQEPDTDRHTETWHVNACYSFVYTLPKAVWLHSRQPSITKTTGETKLTYAQKGSLTAGGAGALRPFPRILFAVPGLRNVLGSDCGVVQAAERVKGPGAPGGQSLWPEEACVEMSGSEITFVFFA